MESFIVGFLKEHCILISDVYVTEYNHAYGVHLTLLSPQVRVKSRSGFVSKRKANKRKFVNAFYRGLDKILFALKGLLILRYNKNVTLNVKVSRSYYYDDKLMSS
jgi:hypothetical protein